MQVHFSYQHGSPHSQLEVIIGNSVSKLEKLLTHFSSDIVHLHGTIEFGTTKQEPQCSLHLWLPTAKIHAKEHGSDLPVVVRSAFERVESQVKKHKEILRHEGERKRGKIGAVLGARQAGDGQFQINTRQQLREYLEQVLPQLKTFVAREIRFQEMSGSRHVPGRDDEVVNEVAARVLDRHKEFAHSDAPFHGLLKEAVQALNGGLHDAEPEATRSGHKWMHHDDADPVERCLALMPPKTRQLYVLHTLEGFTVDEAAQVLGELPSDVEAAVKQVTMEVSAAIHAVRPAGGAVPAVQS